MNFQQNKKNSELFYQFIHGSKIIHETKPSQSGLNIFPFVVHNLHLKLVLFTQYINITYQVIALTRINKLK